MLMPMTSLRLPAGLQQALGRAADHVQRLMVGMVILTSQRRIEAWLRDRLITGGQAGGGTPMHVRRGERGRTSIGYKVELHAGRAVQQRCYLKVIIGRGEVAESIAGREAVALQSLAGSGVPAPELLARDSAVLGVPKLLLTQLDGTAFFTTRMLRSSVGAVGRILGRLHAHQIADPAVRSIWQQWGVERPASCTIPPWAAQRVVWQRLADWCTTAEFPCHEHVLLHGDCGPQQFVWKDGAPSGLVDWANVREGPREFDLAMYRLVLAALCGVDVAEDFLDQYCRNAGHTPVNQHGWDCAELFRMDTNAMMPMGFSYWLRCANKQEIRRNVNLWAAHLHTKLALPA